MVLDSLPSTLTAAMLRLPFGSDHGRTALLRFDSASRAVRTCDETEAVKSIDWNVSAAVAAGGNGSVSLCASHRASRGRRLSRGLKVSRMWVKETDKGKAKFGYGGAS